MSSHLITITADGKTLTCGPGQRIPSPDGQVRAANDLREGMRIFMLADPGEGQMPGLRECAVEKWEKRVCLDDANDRGYHELYYPEFELSPIPLVKELQGRYDNYFANGFLLGESFVEKKRDKKPGAHDGNEGGEDDGDKPGDPAKEPEPVHPQNLVRDTATDGDFAEPPKMAIELTAQDERLFRESLSALDPKLREAVEIVLSAPTARDAERIGRFREAVGMDFSKLAGLARDYLTYRQEILQAEHPQCLAETARIGVPLSYLLWEGGQGVAAHAVLEDVLLVQMRLALREDQGREFWNEPRFRMRDTVRFAIEFACWLRWVRPINAVKSNRDQQWDAVWPSGGWGDMLRYAAEKGQIFDDVRGQTAKGVQYCRLWNLVRQLDQRSGVRLPVNGFVSPGFIQGHEWEGEAAERYRMN